jgi:hypothetical protein
VNEKNDDEQFKDELTPNPSAEGESFEESNERTVFDTEMLERLNALGDDEDEEDEPSQNAIIPASRGEVPSQITSLQDIGDLVEPVTQDDHRPLTELDEDEKFEVRAETSQTLNEILDEELAEETKGAPAANDLVGDEPSLAETGADLWDESSEPGDRSLGRSPAVEDDVSVEATAALLIENMPVTKDVDVALHGMSDGEDRTDQATSPEMVRLECTSDHPALEVADRALVLGRSSGCDVPIDDPTMSRRHCNIWLREGQVWIEDLGSGNGTWINDQRIAEPTALEPGQNLRLGQNVVFLMPTLKADEEEEVEAKTRLAAAYNEPLLGPSGGHSTTYAHGHRRSLESRFKSFIPLAAASLIFAVGAGVFFVRQGRAQARQEQLSQATNQFFSGIKNLRDGQFQKAGETFDKVGSIDPKHPRLPLYRKTALHLARQSALLDEAEAAIKAGRMQDAAATLVTMDPAPQLAERTKTLNASIDSERVSETVAGFDRALTEGQTTDAEGILKALRSSSLDRQTLDTLEGRLDQARNKTRATGKRRAKPARRKNASGPLKRMHLALRQGRVDEAFRINRELAASGVRQAEKLENNGNLGELRDLVRMAQSAAGRDDWKQGLKVTERGLKLLRSISPNATGTFALLRKTRAQAYYARAVQAAGRDKFCSAYKFFSQTKKLNPRHPKLRAAIAKFAEFARQQLDLAKGQLAKGYPLADVRVALNNAVCTSSRSSKVNKEAKALLKGR